MISPNGGYKLKEGVGKERKEKKEEEDGKGRRQIYGGFLSKLIHALCSCCKFPFLYCFSNLKDKT